MEDEAADGRRQYHELSRFGAADERRQYHELPRFGAAVMRAEAARLQHTLGPAGLLRPAR